jgi:tetratricopeptide (TPR) repeat protein
MALFVSKLYTRILLVVIFCNFINCIDREDKKQNSTLLREKALGYIKIKKFTEAKDLLDECLSINPSDPMGYILRSGTEEAIGNYTNALEDLNKAIHLNPFRALSFFRRGTIKTHLNDTLGALADLSKAINLDAANPKYFILRGLLKEHKKDYKGAMHDYSLSINLDSTNSEVFRRRGILHILLDKDFNSAIKDFTKAIIRDSANQVAYFNRGVSFLWISNRNKACEDFSRSGELGYGPAFDFIKLNCNNESELIQFPHFPLPIK